MVSAANCLKLAGLFQLIVFAWPLILSAQDSTDINPVHRDFRYNDINVDLNSGLSESGLISHFYQDSLIILSEGINKAISLGDIKKVSFTSPADFSGSVLSGLLLGMYLGNVLFYQANDVHNIMIVREEPFALAGRDYPEEFGAFAINALFAFTGASIMYLVSPTKIKTTVDFGEYKNGNHDQRDYLYRYLTGEKMIRDNRFHISLATGRLFDRVLDPFIEGSRQLLYSNRLSGYFNFVRKLQASITITKKLRVGAAVFFQGEPSIAGEYFSEENPYYALIRYDARGYYAIVSYTVLSRELTGNIEFLVGGGAGQLVPDFEYIRRDYFFSDNLNDQIIYNTPQMAGILFAELHLYMTDHFSLMFAMDYSQSSEITIGAQESQIRLPTFTFSNGSFGFGVGFHF